MESKSQRPEGLLATLGLIAMLVLFGLVGVESPATLPLAGATVVFFSLAIVVHLIRQWQNPVQGSVVSMLRRHRYVLASFAFAAVVIAANKTDSLTQGVAGGLVAFLFISIAYLSGVSWLEHFFEMRALVTKNRGQFLQNPRGWFHWDVLVAFAPFVIVLGALIAAFVF